METYEEVVLAINSIIIWYKNIECDNSISIDINWYMTNGNVNTIDKSEIKNDENKIKLQVCILNTCIRLSLRLIKACMPAFTMKSSYFNPSKFPTFFLIKLCNFHPPCLII